MCYISGMSGDRISSLRRRLENLYRIAESFDGSASESISTPNGGSRSVTYTSLAQVEQMIDQLEQKLAAAETAASRPLGFGVAYPDWKC